MMRRTGRAMAVGAIAAVLALGVAAPAAAHSVLIGSTPAAGEVLDALPEHYSVTMNERLLADAGTSAFAMRVRDADGLYYGDGCVQVVDERMSTVAAIGDAGSANAPSCGADPAPAEPGTASDHHDAAPSEVPLGDIAWIVGAVLVVGIAVTIALVASRRRA